jgi:hypothetical protein
MIKTKINNLKMVQLNIEETNSEQIKKMFEL